MPTYKWTRRDLVTKALISREVPTKIVNSLERVEITISLETYKRLVDWASVGRTIDRAIEHIEISTMDGNFEASDELAALKTALDDCGQSCRQHWLNL